MLERFQPGEPILKPLLVQDVVRQPSEAVDAVVRLAFSMDEEGHSFSVETKSRSTPEIVQGAIQQALRHASRTDRHPMIQVPYLSPERLDELESMGVSGIDLCGNGLVVVPGRLLVLRTGQPNRYPDSRPLANPFRGRSSLVARAFIEQPEWKTLGDLAEAIQQKSQRRGLSLSQVSKAVAALAEELVIDKSRNQIALIDPARLLDGLGHAWRQRPRPKVYYYRSDTNKVPLHKLLEALDLAWTVSGESSAPRYCTLAQGGPMHIVVSSLKRAESILPIEREHVQGFASIALTEDDEDGYFFANEEDSNGVRYASRLQTWLELNAGDARQHETARDLRSTMTQSIGR